MSCVEYLEGDSPLIKNDILLPELNIYPNEYLSLKEEEEKNEEKSISEESNFQNFIRRELFLKEMNGKNFLSENDDDDLDDTRRYEISSCKRPNSNNLNSSYFPNLDLINPLDINNKNEQPNLNNSLSAQNKSNKKIFNIVKVPKNKQQIFQCLQKKRLPGDSRWGKKFVCDWENIPVPKEKHFHFDRKKHRIVFQRRHLKVIYSIVDLTYPFNFNKCFEMIKEHIGDKTVQNYDKGKSFHIIKINNEEKIVTLKDKKILLKQNKSKKKSLIGVENSEKTRKNSNKDEKSNSSVNTSSNSSFGNTTEKAEETKEK
jgi:hypothetical protein